MALYAVLRAGVRFFGYALPGSCVSNTAINWAFWQTGSCLPAGNWLDTRMSFITSAHAWSWLMYGGFALAIAIYPWNGRLNGWLAFMLTGFAIAYHELFWFGTYFILHPNTYNLWMNLQVYGSFIAFAIEGVIVFWGLGFFKKLDMRILIIGTFAVVLFYAGWGSIGYPLTLDLKTGMFPPAMPGVLWVDFIEFASWLIVFTIIGAAFWAKRVGVSVS